MQSPATYTAFEDQQILVQGTLPEVVRRVKRRLGRSAHTSVVIFSDDTGGTIDFNFHGSEEDVAKRLEIFVASSPEKEQAGPGRPKLGVISREISLLPRHWEWLAAQPGGASATLRQLVESASKKTVDGVTDKKVQEKTYRFMSVLAGDLEGYEEALRALYKKDKRTFLSRIENWPRDVRAYAVALSKPLFEEKKP